MCLQVVLTSTNPSELCINGMSFSRRSSKWANAALVVTVTSKDFDALNLHGPLAGVEFQVHFFSLSDSVSTDWSHASFQHVISWKLKGTKSKL